MDDVDKLTAMAGADASAAARRDGVFHLAEGHRFVGVRGDSQRVAGTSHLFEAENTVAAFDFDAADSFARTGEDRDVVDGEVN